MYIIPAIDILDGKVVRLREGDYNQKTVYEVSIAEMIETYRSNGTEFIHIIDLNGAKGDFSNQAALFDIIKKTDMRVQYGGGIRTIEQVTNLLDAGIHRVIVGTQAITNPSFLEELSKEVGKKYDYANRIVIAIDVLDEVIKYSGWMESSPIKLMDYVDKCLQLGFFRFLCTDINKDGKLGGAALDLYQKLLEHSPFIKLIASGGVSSMQDIEELAKLDIRSVVVGKAIYENRITIEEIKEWNLKAMTSL
ncbi:1-(5-phosphoribosyl)-5-[(5-phosphoribosylamino)methylideneamino]imidazole-4-carboxamide isomerase [Pedobacter antarcticus]|uniref:1-(5-phosphoribosyl)-5-[(5-phosphoribosylamino)methylideneamino] imidazole-4-carboxamide isomerase n=2 Tax=Pedobacter antarcticus TaxID=34086 RepID=A0A081PFC4_9SPHI|nr:1-(5-phosphoribosyl)-5-[(5-phosphoribosylamino)methylideneamino]imidazole-4-carboxamide isomerase [Pedobacter antarcticus]KEQ29397.1 phosphoribosylformimino-5-aminoimidazole carboxamide ribotide isomerase [Pedobacter antarcticus 4BY]SDM67159.1 1-(5-phosphoribosyl)-5-[(5-phosphoribosylamino)methylideneamino] imidazole-4-carboxamide isomerase [Pedobacter antarcticus]SFF40234.1 1-(5-phosphoribosyl)-5-[(5-phosphoribosylamino)methylideneamino] imidazole-4-carboxamide isomerase [Pedobacter antarcti